MPWKRRVVVGLGVFLAILLVGGVAGYGYLSFRLGQVRRVEPSGLTPPGRAMTVLLVGSDSRADLKPGEATHFGNAKQVAGQRSDVIMVLHTDPDQAKASVLSIPRDLYVSIAGTGRSNRINVAFENGPGRLIQTIHSELGLPIDHYVQVNFDGFRGIVDAMGGLDVFFPSPARDILAELNVPAAGCIHLSGAQALAYVRSRHYESFEAGKWKTDPTSDIGRIQRQQDFIRRMMKNAVSSSIRNPFTANRLLNAFVPNITLDGALGTGDLFRLGTKFRSLNPEAVDMLTLPTAPEVVHGAEVLRLKQPEAGQTIERFLHPPLPQASETPGGKAPPVIPPSSVRIRVLNGSGRAGQAGIAAKQLERAGFRIAGTGDSGGLKTSGNVIRYGPGQREKGVVVQTAIVGGGDLVADSNVKGSDVVLVTGASFARIRSAGAASPAAPAAPSPPAGQAPPKPPC